MDDIAQIQAECDCPRSYYLKCQAAGRCLEVKAGELMDDDINGIPQRPRERRIIWCAKCKKAAATCNCYKEVPEENFIITVALIILTCLLIALVALFLWR